MANPYLAIEDEIAGQRPSVPTSPSRANPYLAIEEQVQSLADAAARNALYGTLGANPDRAAKAAVLGKRFGLAPDTVEADFDGIERRALLEDRDKAVQAAPKLKAWVADGTNAKVAADDLDSLAGIERAVQAYETANGPLDRLGQRLRSGAVTLARNVDVTAAVSAGEALSLFDAVDQGETPAALRARLYGEGHGRTRARTGIDDLTDQYFGATPNERAELRGQYQSVFSDNLREAAERTQTVAAIPRNPAADAAMSKGAKGDYAGAWEAFLVDPIGVIGQIGAESFPQALPGMALSTVVGPVVGMGVGSATTEYLSSVVEGLQAEGLDLAKPETLDRLRDPAVLERVRTRAAIRAAVVGTFDGASGGLLGRSLLPEPAKGATRVKRLARGAAELGAQAAAQGAMGAAGEASAELAVGDALDPVQIAAEFLGEFAGAPGEVASALLHRRVQDRATPVAGDARRVSEAGDNQARLDALVDASGGSRLRERDPERFRSLVGEQTQGTAVETVQIPADAFVAYFQSQNIDPETLASELPDLMAQLPSALASGGDLVIPVADYLSRLAPDHHAGLRDDVRVGTDGLTPREARAVEADLPKALDLAAEAAVASVTSDDAAARSAQAVYDDVRQQLLAAGRAPDVAAREATVWRAFFRTMGERAGVAPLDLYQRYGLRVRRDLPAALKSRDVNELDLLIERLRARRTQSQEELHGPSLLEFVAGEGGVIDAGGDLRSQDADKWHKGKAFRKRLLRDSGVPLDVMAERAWEAGYFPEAGDERPDINTLLDAMQAELRGQRRYADRPENRHDADTEQAARDLEQVLDELGVDVAATPNADIKRALDTGRVDDGAAVGTVYDQAAAEADVRSVLNAAAEPGNRSTKVQIGTASPWLVEAARKVGLDLGGFTHALDSSAVRHIRKNHGDAAKEAARGQLPITDVDLLAIPSLLAAPDMLAFGTKNRLGHDQVAYLKTMPDGSTLYLEEVRGGRRELAAMSMRKYPATMNAASILATLDPNARSDGGSLIIVDVPTGSSAIQSGYDQKRGDSPRGRIQISADRKVLITLFERADLSTVLHESGHFFLEVLRDLASRPDAAQSIRDDWAAALAWMGARDGDAIETRHHERWARGFEAYLMEGKAPSRELQGVFDRFRAWLTSIYRSLTALRATLSPEIRSVFDRMLAVEEEIAAVSREARLAPLFETAQAAGMTEEEFRAYTTAAEAARSEAGAALLARALKDVTRRRARWWQTEWATVRAQVAEEVAHRPVYAALVALQRGTYPDGSPLPEPIKLSRAALVEQFGPEVLKLLPKPYVYSGKGGLHPDHVAELFGIGSGDELVKALMNVQPLKAVVDAETQQRMEAEHGDLMTDGRLHEEALATVRSQQRGRLLATELKALRRLGADAALRAAAERSVQEEGAAPIQQYRDAAVAASERAAIQEEGNATPEARDAARMVEALAAARSDAATGQRRAQAAALRQTRATMDSIDVEAIQRAAARQIGAKAVKDATAIERYAAAEVRVARRVEEAVAKRDYAMAAKAKEQQLLSHYLVLEARKAEQEVAASLEKWARLRKSDERLTKGVDENYIYAARAILTRHGLDFSRFDLPLWADRLRREDPEAAGRVTLAMEAMLAPLPLPHRDMMMDDFRSLGDAVSNLIEVGRSVKTIEIDGRREDLRDAVQAMAAQVADRAGGARPGETSAVTEGDKLKVGLLGIRAALTRVESWARVMDRGLDGPFTRYLVRPVMTAVNDYRDAKRARLEQLLAILEPRRKDLRGPKIPAPELNYRFDNKGELLHAIAHTGNESNQTKLLEGRGWTQRGWEALLSRLAREGTLTKADFDTVQALWDLNEELKADAQKAHKTLYGYHFAEVTARPVTTPFGVYRGGYMPAITDRYQIADGQGRADAESLSGEQTGSMFPSTGRGFTKSRVENYTKPLELDLMKVPAHLDSVLRFSHLQPTIQQLGRFTIDHGFREALYQVDPTVVSDLLVPWLQRTARQSVDTPSVGAAGRQADKFWRGLRKRTGLQMMVANVLNAAQQITGFSTAAVRVRPAALGRGLMAVLKSGASAEIERKSAFMRNRMTAGSIDLMQRAEDILTASSGLNDLRRWSDRHGYFLQSGFQNVTDRVVWLAAYEEATLAGQSDADAVYAADHTVRATQGSFAPEDVSRIETGPAFMRLFTMFYSYFNAQANLLAGDGALALRALGWRGGMGRLAWLYVFGMMIPAVLAEAVVRGAKGELGDDEDDGLLDDVASLFFGSQARFLAGMVPAVGPAAVAAANVWNSVPYDDRLSTSPAVSMVETTLRAPVSLWKALAEDGNGGRAVRDSLTMLGLLSGLPLGQLGKPLGYAADVAVGDAVPEGLGDVLSGILTGRQPKR